MNLFVHTGKSYDYDYKDLSNLAVQVDVIIGGGQFNIIRMTKADNSGQLNSPLTIDSNTSETFTLSNGFHARVVNIYYLLRGKFHAFMTRGQTHANDYQDLVFLITKYIPHILSYVHLERHRLDNIFTIRLEIRYDPDRISQKRSKKSK